MKFRIATIFAISVLSAGCASTAGDTARRSEAGVTRAQAVKAFSDAVLGHCLPAIHREETFSEFEVDGVTPIGQLWENRTPLFQNETLPIHQMVEGVVQLQLDPFSSCQVASNDLPVEVTFNLIGDALLQTAYGYTEQESGYPQDGDRLSRVFVSGTGDDMVTVALDGMKDGATSSTTLYSNLKASVTAGPLNN
ncbi:hypothetical protein [Henriciella sp.]|uniref:hypothetical protein n=1 Tax=Henriciella sp. TaxID=1968823 RepID=UPI002621556A|nr:hypothetical protein [Henriciella sp.]